MARIYLSATYSDLKTSRDAVYRILRMLRHDVVSMEDYVATDAYPLHKCLADVAACEVYVGLFGWRYGYVPDKDNPTQLSITELEYRKAGDAGLPRLLFLADPAATWPDEFRDTHTGEGEAGQRIADFRAELGSETLVSFFRTPDHLAGLVSVAVTLCLENSPLAKPKLRSRVLEIKYQALDRRLKALLEDYQAATQQLAYALSAVDQNKLKRQIAHIEQDINQVESDLDGIGAGD